MVQRELLPSRRRNWTQTVKIENQRFYLCVGSYADGRIGEVFVDAHKMGTFSRGVLDALARMTSLALQMGASTKEVVSLLSGLSFPPCGQVTGSPYVTEASSVADWMAQEISCAYLTSGMPVVPVSLDKVADNTSSDPGW